MTWINTEVRTDIRGIILRVPWRFQPERSKLTGASRVLELESQLREHDIIHEGAQIYSYRMCHDRAAEELGILDHTFAPVEGEWEPFPVWDVVQRWDEVLGAHFWTLAHAEPSKHEKQLEDLLRECAKLINSEWSEPGPDKILERIRAAGVKDE